MSIQVNDNFKYSAPKDPIDFQGIVDSGTGKWRPYASKSEIFTKVTQFYKGQSFKIYNSANGQIENWYFPADTFTEGDLLKGIDNSDKSLTLTTAGLRGILSPRTDVIYQTFDNGGGQWYYDANSSLSDDLGVVLKPTSVSGNGRFVRIFTRAINVVWYGAVGNNTFDDTPAFIASIAAAKKYKIYTIEIPPPSVKWKITQTLSVTSTDFPSSGLSIYGTGSSGSVQIEYTGTGYCWSFLGVGNEGGTPLTRFECKNLRVNGGTNNTVSMGGFEVDRCYIVRFENVFSTGWYKAPIGGDIMTGANAFSLGNVFNFQWDGGQIANGYPGPAGGYSVKVGSRTPDAWNCSNVEFKNLLIQYSGSHGVYVDQQGNIFDNLSFNNVSFGKNGGYHVFSTTPNINNISFDNCHGESPGYTVTSTPNPNTGHIHIANANCVKIANCSLQDALTYISFDSVQAWSVDNCKFFETGNYDLTGNVMLRLRTTTANCIGWFGTNFVRTDQIDILYDFVPSGGFRVDAARVPVTKVVESTWNGEIFPNPVAYQGSEIDRYQSTNAPFDRMISSGTNWYRNMISSKYKGERTTIPTTTEGAGSWYANSAPTVQGQTGSAYIVFGWNTSGGGAWKDMRMPLDQAPFVINTTTTDLSQATLNSTYVDGTANVNLGKIIYCPNIVAGAKIYIKVTATLWLTLYDKSYFDSRVGQTTLVAGTKAITIAGITTASMAFVQLVTPGGTTNTRSYQAVCTTNTLTIRANIDVGTINTADTSTLNYNVIN